MAGYLDAITSAGPSPLYFAERLTEQLGGAKIYLKREELNHTGAHKINNVLGQILLAKRMGKKRIIAETGAGQHGVATATVCARFGLPCIVYMGAVDVERQKPNVFRMKLLGAEVVPVHVGLAHAQGRDERGAARLGRPTSTTPSTASAPRPARIPIPPWCATSRASSAARRASRCWSARAACPTRWSPASAAAPTPSACSTPSSTTRTWRSTASRRPATA